MAVIPLIKKLSESRVSIFRSAFQSSTLPVTYINRPSDATMCRTASSEGKTNQGSKRQNFPQTFSTGIPLVCISVYTNIFQYSGGEL